jgi:hypothetical protein
VEHKISIFILHTREVIPGNRRGRGTRGITSHQSRAYYLSGLY